MTEKPEDSTDKTFLKRRGLAIERVNRVGAAAVKDNPERGDFFETVYEDAAGDAAMVPWADLEPKPQLVEWLQSAPSVRGRAIDVGCGLGDTAEALSIAGYEVTGFDYSPDAIAWARQRFPDSKVIYETADLFNLPKEWRKAFDLVTEIYILQALPPETLARTMPAIASLVAPGGTLLSYTRIRADGASVEGPPWPLEETAAMKFTQFGFELVSKSGFEIERHGRIVPIWFCEWRRNT